MSFKIKIVNNDTGEVLCDENNARAIIGAVGTNETVHCMSFVRANGITLYHTVGGVQDVLAKVSEEHPEFNILAQIENFMENLENKSDGNRETT